MEAAPKPVDLMLKGQIFVFSVTLVSFVPLCLQFFLYFNTRNLLAIVSSEPTNKVERVLIALCKRHHNDCVLRVCLTLLCVMDEPFGADN